MSRYTALTLLGVLLQATACFGEKLHRVAERDKPLSQSVTDKLKQGIPVMEVLEFEPSYKVSDDYLQEGEDYIYVDFIFGNPDNKLTYEKPGPHVTVFLLDNSSLIMCIMSYENCGNKYRDKYSLPCNCKNVSTIYYSAVRVKGYWSVKSIASQGLYTIVWDQQIDKFLYPNVTGDEITALFQLPKILPARTNPSGDTKRPISHAASSLYVTTPFLHLAFAWFILNCHHSATLM